MSDIISIIVPVLVLLVTVGQWRLQQKQQIHNEKSVKPLGQIVLEDHRQTIGVHLHNNGLGPLIIDKITFTKAGMTCSRLEDCLDLEPKSYMRTSTNDLVTRVILPNSSLPIFEDQLKGQESEAELNHIRHQLSPITLKVEFHDIYDNKMTIERDFCWFARHLSEQNQTSL